MAQQTMSRRSALIVLAVFLLFISGAVYYSDQQNANQAKVYEQEGTEIEASVSQKRTEQGGRRNAHTWYILRVSYGSVLEGGLQFFDVQVNKTCYETVTDRDKIKLLYLPDDLEAGAIPSKPEWRALTDDSSLITQILAGLGGLVLVLAFVVKEPKSA